MARKVLRIAVCLTALTAVTACGAGGAGPLAAATTDRATTSPVTPSATPSAGPTATPPTPTATPTPVVPATTRPAVVATTPAPARVAFSATVATVTTAQLGGSWHAGCPVGAAQLRQLTMTYWGFDARPHTGVMVVSAEVTGAVIAVFRRLYDDRFPVRSMRPTADFGGSDPASMAADNTSGFNCRLAVAPGPPQWSVHAYGKAIDVDTIENPYIEGGTVMPAAGAAFTDRAELRPGMAVRGGTLVEAFAAVGWPWGGRWSDPDYQHFSATGG